MHETQNVMQTAVHTAVPLKPEHNASDVEMANEKLKGYVSRHCTNTGRTERNNRMLLFCINLKISDNSRTYTLPFA